MIPKIKKKLKSILLKTVWSFGPEDLIRVIRKMGVHKGDVVMVHSSWKTDSGFRGTPQQLVQAFIDTVGQTGTLCMMSMPFHNMTAAEYLKKGKVFDVRKTVSMVGLPSEIFRRRKDAVRSLHPTHSVAACGPKAEWLIEGHEKCLSPFGSKSPFDKMVQANAKLLMYDVPFNTMTFEHYLEDRFQESLPRPLYNESLQEGKCRDQFKTEVIVKTKVIANELNMLRSDRLESTLGEWNCLRTGSVARTSLKVLSCRSAVQYIAALDGHMKPFYISPTSLSGIVP
ncbi:MAG: AAC(3) family N-acetyltransferase [Deltaproteobacteria bacterium]|nr:AAC(3) family N-acetyltransferase [Deltaproteobacteria bacterium]